MEIVCEELQKQGISVDFKTFELLEIYYKDYAEKECVEYYWINGIWPLKITDLSDEDYWELSRMHRSIIWNCPNSQKEDSNIISESADNIINEILEKFEE